MVGGDRGVQARDRGRHRPDERAAGEPGLKHREGQRHHQHRHGPPEQPFRREPGQQGRGEQAEQHKPVRLPQAAQPREVNEPGVGQQHGHPHTVRDYGQRHEPLVPDPQHRAQRNDRAGQPGQPEQPRGRPPPGHHQAKQGQQREHHTEGRHALLAGLVMKDRRDGVQAEELSPRRRREHAVQRHPVPGVLVREHRGGQGGPAVNRLLCHGHDLRAGDQHGDAGGEGRLAQCGGGAAAGQPAQQYRRGQHRSHDRRFLVDQECGTDHHANTGGATPSGAAAQPHRGLQGKREEQRPEGDVEVVPVLPDQHGAEAVEGAGHHRAGGGGQPQPGRTVAQVARQPRDDDGQQVVARARPERERDRRHQQAGQRHQRVEAKLRPDRGGQVCREPRVAQVGHLVSDPPEVPHVAALIKVGRQAAGQVAGPGPGQDDPGGDVAQQQRQLEGPPARGGRGAPPCHGGRRRGARLPGRLTVPCRPGRFCGGTAGIQRGGAAGHAGFLFHPAF